MLCYEQKSLQELIIFIEFLNIALFFSRKYDIVPVRGKLMMILFKKIYERFIFLHIYMYKCYKGHIIFLPKKQRFPGKIHLKVTFSASLKKIIFMLENTVFHLKHNIDCHCRFVF